MPRYVLSVDPGKATGVAFFSFEKGGEPVLLKSWEVTFDTFADTVRSCLYHYPNTEVVCERFTITAKTAQNSQAPYSLEHIGILKQCMVDAGQSIDRLTLQTPTDAKNMFPNPALKKLEYWHRGGAGHALDAIRHGLLHLTKTGWKPARLLQD
jgi:hypothetical protein